MNQVSMTSSSQWGDAIDPAAFLDSTVRSRHYGPIRTTEVLTTDYEAVIRDAGDYVGRHRLSNAWVLREERFKVNLRGNR